jgi:hypothetical protein
LQGYWPSVIFHFLPAKKGEEENAPAHPGDGKKGQDAAGCGYGYYRTRKKIFNMLMI